MSLFKGNKYTSVIVKQASLYVLKRTNPNDNFGIAGRYLSAVDNGFSIDRIIKIGYSVLCSQGIAVYVITTPVTKILKVNKDKTKVTFKTLNSTYSLTCL